MYQVGGQTIVSVSEAGHISIPIQTERDLDLAQFLAGETGPATVEHAISGSGLAQVFGWHASRARLDTSRSGAEVVAGASKGEPMATAALTDFVRILGTVCSDLAMTHLPFGGIYLVGGVSRSVTPYLTRLGFVEAFHNKGRFSDFMSQFNVETVEDDFAALHGAAAFVRQQATT